MKQIDKPEWKESLECYLFIFIILLLFFGTIVMSGQLTGTDWISLFSKFTFDVNVDVLKQLFLLE
ncbi:hypothetical protein JNUCC74_01240 [Cerasibacillus sp. JNUCC 74]